MGNLLYRIDLSEVFWACVLMYLLMGVFVIVPKNAGCATAAVRLSSHHMHAFAKISGCAHNFRQPIFFPFTFGPLQLSVLVLFWYLTFHCIFLTFRDSCWRQPSLLHRLMSPIFHAMCTWLYVSCGKLTFRVVIERCSWHSYCPVNLWHLVGCGMQVCPVQLHHGRAGWRCM